MDRFETPIWGPFWKLLGSLWGALERQIDEKRESENGSKNVYELRPGHLPQDTRVMAWLVPNKASFFEPRGLQGSLDCEKNKKGSPSHAPTCFGHGGGFGVGESGGWFCWLVIQVLEVSVLKDKSHYCSMMATARTIQARLKSFYSKRFQMQAWPSRFNPSMPVILCVCACEEVTHS